MTTTGALSQLLEPLSQALTPEAARCISDFRIPPPVQARIDELAELCNEGLLTDAERAEYASFVDGVMLINVLQSKVRRAISSYAGA